jgi:arsenite methyltransferase
VSALKLLGINQADVSLLSKSAEQSQTRDAFAFKWARRDTYESPAVSTNMRNWLIERYCNGDSDQLARWLDGDRKIILDAGCGSGHSGLLLFGDHLKRHDYLGIDISSAVDVARVRFAEAGYEADFLQSDLLDLPVPDASIDMIFSEGVLHHTDSTEGAIKSLSTKLKLGGRFLFYVYVKKAVIREFTDDYVREKLRTLTDEQAWKALEPLTLLGRELGKLNVDINVPKDIPFLGIKAGKLDLQRFFYWNICKTFYREDFSMDEMNHINFDWFRPLNCHRHTESEVRLWCEEAKLSIEHMDVSDSGITVVALKA